MILLYGDSLVEGLSLGAGFHAEFSPGATIEALLNNHFGLPFLLNEDNYKVVVIIAGTNDIGHGTTNTDIIQNLITLHKIAWDKNIPTIVVGLKSKSFNQKLQEKLGEFSYQTPFRYCGYLEELTDEDLHLTDEQKTQLSTKIKELCQEFFPVSSSL